MNAQSLPPQQVATDTAPAKASTSAPLPEPGYTGVFYLRRDDGTLVALPHKSPEVKSKFKTSLLVGTNGGTEVSKPIFIIRLAGSGDPSQSIQMALVENGKIPLGNISMLTLPAQNVSLSWMIENQQGRRK
jgi:hypothetical protein